MARRKHRVLPPQRKRMKRPARPARLQAARAWLAGFGGKKLVRSYARWFGVDLLCAVKELRMLGVELDPEYVLQLEATVANRAAARLASRAEHAVPMEAEESQWWETAEEPFMSPSVAKGDDVASAEMGTEWRPSGDGEPDSGDELPF